MADAKNPAGDLRVGTASWTDKTLLASGWYPADASSAEDRLRYYAEQFPVVEVDSTYYTPPNEANSERWVARTPEGFRFDVKAFSLLTQHPTRPTALYKDLRPETDKRNVYAKDLEPKVVDEVWERFLSALGPLHDADKLGAVLFQFPQWFTLKRANKDYLLECKERAAPYRISVEFRSATWFRNEAATEETLDFLRSYGLPFVCVDMPQGHSSSVPPVVAATSKDMAIVRFHGHSDKWQSRDIYERFGYLYDEAELRPWAPRLRELAGQTAETHVLLNNCYRNYAQVNARQLADLIGTT
jgi:uncharacterized protein YecE (DUF72 family)